MSAWLAAGALGLALMCHSATAAGQFPIERLGAGGYVVMLATPWRQG
jgi:hypothetical protein